MISGRHWICQTCDAFELGGSVSTMAPVEQWSKCELCGKPTLNICSDQQTAAIKRMREMEQRIASALEVIERYGGIDGEHHKTWVIDQAVRALVPDYGAWVREMRAGEDGPETYDWNVGIAP